MRSSGIPSSLDKKTTYLYRASVLAEVAEVAVAKGANALSYERGVLTE